MELQWPPKRGPVDKDGKLTEREMMDIAIEEATQGRVSDPY